MGFNNELLEGNQKSAEKVDNKVLSVADIMKPGEITRFDNTKMADSKMDNILPPMMLIEARTGSEAKAQEIKESGVHCTRHSKDGVTNVKAEYPSGVVLESSEDKNQRASKHGNAVVTETGIVSIEAKAPNHMNSKGEVIDEKGRIIAKQNADGSVTVDSGKGFYTQYPDGEIRRESALRSRNGKDFEVLDTNNPLGGMQVPDQVKPERKH